MFTLFYFNNNIYLIIQKASLIHAKINKNWGPPTGRGALSRRLVRLCLGPALGPFPHLLLEHGALGSWSPGRGVAGLGCSRLDPGEASYRRLPVAVAALPPRSSAPPLAVAAIQGELVLRWLSSAAAGGSSAALDSPSVPRPGRRSPTLGASVAGLALHTPPKWLSLGPSNTGRCWYKMFIGD